MADIPGVVVLDNVVEKCDEIIEWLEAQESWKPATLMQAADGERYTNPDIRSSDTLFLPVMSFDNPPIVYDMNKAVWSAMNDYATEYLFAFHDIEHVSVNRYQIGQEFRSHDDRAPGSNRVLSALLYLNDVEEGGETIFDFFYEAVLPRAGRLVLFPSFYLYRHTAMPPMSGPKYSAAYWAVG